MKIKYPLQLLICAFSVKKFTSHTASETQGKAIIQFVK